MVQSNRLSGLLNFFLTLVYRAFIFNVVLSRCRQVTLVCLEVPNKDRRFLECEQSWEDHDDDGAGKTARRNHCRSCRYTMVVRIIQLTIMDKHRLVQMRCYAKLREDLVSV